MSPTDARRRTTSRASDPSTRRSSTPAPGDQPPPVAAAAAADATPEVVLKVDGVIDTGGADRLRAQLEDAVAPRRRLVLDLADVEHLSSAALAVLVSGHRRLRDGGGALVVRAPSPAVVRELRISGLHRVIAVDPPEPAPA